MIAPKTSVLKITAMLGIDDTEFRKTLNIIDYWLQIESPQKSLQTNIICNMLSNPRNIEQLKLDISSHDKALPSTHVIQNLIEGTFNTELKIDYDREQRMDCKWSDYAQRKTYVVF